VASPGSSRRVFLDEGEAPRRASRGGGGAPAFALVQNTIKQYPETGRIEMIMRYSIVLEHGPQNFSAYAPDFPGCVAAAKTEAETLALMKEALELHIEDMRERGETIPKPSEIREVEVAA
jgi:predicted RNase H-like HicB family nuclease